MGDDSNAAGCLMLILAAIGVSFFIGRCSVSTKSPKQEEVKPQKNIEHIVKKKETAPKIVPKQTYTITTKIIDVQQSTIHYKAQNMIKEHTYDGEIHERSATIKYIHASGGDVTEKLLIEPNAAEFIRKYVPVKITYEKTDGKVILKDLITKFYDKKSLIKKIQGKSEAIKADGIVTKIEYIGDEDGR